MMLNGGEAMNLAGSLEDVKPSVVMETIKNALPGMIHLGVRLLIALLILVAGRKIITMLKRALGRSFERMNIEAGLGNFLLSVANVALYVVLVLIIADYMGIQSTSIFAVLGSASLAVGLALQGSLANFAGGILILAMKPFKAGDYIITPSGEGSVKTIGLVYTTLVTTDNKVVVLPNGTLSNSPLTNVSAMDKRRVDVTVSIAYDADLKKAKEIMEEVLRRQPAIIEEDGITVMLDSLGDSAVNLGGRVWVPGTEYWTTKWNILEEIKMEFDAQGISIPFPQMDVHIQK